jgi:hypothetical protein
MFILSDGMINFQSFPIVILNTHLMDSCKIHELKKYI